MTEATKEGDDLNDGVRIILTRMKTNPEEFFDDGGRWRWMFKDNMREVMTEIEKAAIYEGMKQVRRQEITAKAAATVLRADTPEETGYHISSGAIMGTTVSSTWHDEQVKANSIAKIKESNESLKELLLKSTEPRFRPTKL